MVKKIYCNEFFQIEIIENQKVLTDNGVEFVELSGCIYGIDCHFIPISLAYYIADKLKSLAYNLNYNYDTLGTNLLNCVFYTQIVNK